MTREEFINDDSTDPCGGSGNVSSRLDGVTCVGGHVVGLLLHYLGGAHLDSVPASAVAFKLLQYFMYSDAFGSTGTSPVVRFDPAIGNWTQMKSFVYCGQKAHAGQKLALPSSMGLWQNLSTIAIHGMGISLEDAVNLTRRWSAMFTTRAGLKAAVNEWMANPMQVAQTHGDINTWFVSAVTDMEGMFRGAAAFNGDIGAWDVSAVTDMSSMFSEAAAFNGDIGAWDVSAVTTMRNMFNGAAAFSGDIGAWVVSAVTDMTGMFFGAMAFNGDIGAWDVSAVTHMWGMFNGAAAFNRDLSAWDTAALSCGLRWMQRSPNMPSSGLRQRSVHPSLHPERRV